jgi:predicted nucleotidyltransferase
MPTALELGSEGWKPFLEASRRRNPARVTPGEETLRANLLACAREAAKALKAEFGARRVVLFGSLAHQAWFDATSDVDLAVEGLTPGEYWGAWRRAEEFFSDRKVDVVEYEAVSGSLRKAIDGEGVEL